MNINEIIKRRNNTNELLNEDDNIKRKNNIKEHVIQIIDSMLEEHKYHCDDDLIDELAEINYEEVMKISRERNEKILRTDSNYDTSKYCYTISNQCYLDMLDFSHLDSVFYDYACDAKKLLYFTKYMIEKDFEFERHYLADDERTELSEVLLIDYLFLYELADDIAFQYDLLEKVNNSRSLNLLYVNQEQRNHINDMNVRDKSMSVLTDFVSTYNFAMPIQIELKKDYYYLDSVKVAITQDKDEFNKEYQKSIDRRMSLSDKRRELIDEKFNVQKRINNIENKVSV